MFLNSILAFGPSVVIQLPPTQLQWFQCQDLTFKISRSICVVSIMLPKEIIIKKTQTVQSLDNTLRCGLKSSLKFFSCPLFLPNVIQWSPNFRCAIHFTCLPFGWLARSPQWLNIPLNLSQVWTVTTEVKFTQHHSDWLSPSCSGASLVLSAGAAPERNCGVSQTIPHSSAEWGKADPTASPLQPQTYLWHDVVEDCWQPIMHTTYFCEYSQKSMENDVFLPSFSLSRFSVLVLWLWLQVITFHCLGNHSSFVGPLRSLPILTWAFPALQLSSNTPPQHSLQLNPQKKKQHWLL